MEAAHKNEEKNMKIPFINLKAQYQSIKDEVDTAIQRVIGSSAFAGGPFVEKFEGEFARFCGCRFAIGVGSGTEALLVSLLALGVGEGDEVITVPNTFIATVEAISLCGATPVFVDIDEETYNMDVSKLESAITEKTKGIIPVHLFGQMADMDPIMVLARKYNLYVIEDACQAHGAIYKGKKAGTMGRVGCFSFYPGKNLGAYGDAGAITTNDPILAEKARMLRDHGQGKKYHHDIIGFNSRMDGLQGAVLSVKLKYLETWNDLRRKNATIYGKLLGKKRGVIIPKEKKYGKHVYHIYAIRIKNRDERHAKLRAENIEASIHYPIPVHRQSAFKNHFKANGKLVKSEVCAGELMSLPLFPEMSLDQIVKVVSHIP